MAKGNLKVRLRSYFTDEGKDKILRCFGLQFAMMKRPWENI